MYVQRRVLSGFGQGQQQPRDELRRDRSVNLDLPAADRAADLDRQVAVVVADRHAQPAQRFEHHSHRAAQQRIAPLDDDGRGAERCQRGEEACRKPRFADIEPADPGVEPPLDGERRGVRLTDPGAQRLDAAQGRAGVVAEFEVAQHRNLLRKQRRREGALGITFRTGRRQCAFDAARASRFVHNYSFVSCPLRFFISWVSWWLFLSSKCCPR